jgi:hypothetical protein
MVCARRCFLLEATVCISSVTCCSHARQLVSKEQERCTIHQHGGSAVLLCYTCQAL